jgi:ABC-2 type transport system ATP-binding protein
MIDTIDQLPIIVDYRLACFSIARGEDLEYHQSILFCKPNTGISMSSVITIDHVCKSYGACKAVSDLTLSLNAGEILGFLGTNGAGKTTTIKMLLGFFPPDTGQITVFGQNPSDAHTRQRVGFMPETAYYYPYLNIYELLSFMADFAACPPR